MIGIEGKAERQLVEQLEKVVGPTLATLALGKMQRSESEWTSDMPLRAIERVRLDVALETMGAISESESEDIARAWFIGANVGEDSISPVEALRETRIEEVEISAQRLVNDEWS